MCNKHDCVCTNILQVSFESTKVTVTEEIPLLPGEKVQGIGTDAFKMNCHVPWLWCVQFFEKKNEIGENKAVRSIVIKFWPADYKKFEVVLCTHAYILHSVSLTCTLLSLKLQKKWNSCKYVIKEHCTNSILGLYRSSVQAHSYYVQVFSPALNCI